MATGQVAVADDIDGDVEIEPPIYITRRLLQQLAYIPVTGDEDFSPDEECEPEEAEDYDLVAPPLES